MSLKDPKEVEIKIKTILSKALSIDAEKISPEQRLVEDLGIDSFMSVELVFELEDQAGISIPDKDFMNLKTVQDVISYIQSRLENNDSKKSS